MEYFLIHDLGKKKVTVEKFDNYEKVWKVYEKTLNEELKSFKKNEYRNPRLAIIKGIIVKDSDFFIDSK